MFLHVFLKKEANTHQRREGRLDACRRLRRQSLHGVSSKKSRAKKTGSPLSCLARCSFQARKAHKRFGNRDTMAAWSFISVLVIVEPAGTQKKCRRIQSYRVRRHFCDLKPNWGTLGNLALLCCLPIPYRAACGRSPAWAGPEPSQPARRSAPSRPQACPQAPYSVS